MFRLTLTVISAMIVGAAAFAGVARYTEHAFGLVPVTPYEADVNKDTRVNAIDLQQVAQKFGQAAPTATPSPIGLVFAYVVRQNTGALFTNPGWVLTVLCDEEDIATGWGYEGTHSQVDAIYNAVPRGTTGFSVSTRYEPGGTGGFVYVTCIDNEPRRLP